MNPPSLGTNVEPCWKFCLKGAQWAGRFTVLFTFAFFITALEFRRTGGSVSGWLAATTASFMLLALFSGVFCLVSAACGFALRYRQNSTADRDMVRTDKPTV